MYSKLVLVIGENDRGSKWLINSLMCLPWFLSDYPVPFDHIDTCTCEVLEETVRGFEERLVSEETEKLASYERETQLIFKVTKYNSHIYIF